MNHYLQRLALSAIKPAGTIHPILESVYSARRESTDVPLVEENDFVANTPARLASDSANPAAVPLIPSPRPTVETTQLAITEPLLPRGCVRSVAPAIETGATICGGPEASAADGKSSPLVSDNGRTRAEGTRQANRREESFDRAPSIISQRLQPVALKTNSRQPSQASLRRSPAAETFGLEKTPAKAAKLRRGEPEAREPDEIQIHIGRIEVTAVHPAPTPAAAKPQRNVPSLDEYLRRRDRRSI